MDILIPMAWMWTRFFNNWYKKPKPFLDMDGKTMIDRVLESLNIPWKIILILNWYTDKSKK
jgi:GTP:adenosylcobinamide-phosphate guanylyltransferase